MPVMIFHALLGSPPPRERSISATAGASNCGCALSAPAPWETRGREQRPAPAASRAYPSHWTRGARISGIPAHFACRVVVGSGRACHWAVEEALGAGFQIGLYFAFNVTRRVLRDWRLLIDRLTQLRP